MSEEIQRRIQELANNLGYEIKLKNLPKIAKAKERFFGLDKWSKCPCYPPEDKEHGCGSAACAKDIEKNGICHCNLFLRRKD